MAKTKSLPPAIANEIATTRDGRDITRPFVAALEQPRDPRLLASTDWGVYERILLDDQVKSTLEQRIRAVVSAEWDVLPGDDEDPRAVEAAGALKADLSAIGWDRVTERMLYAVFYGYSVAELLWAPRDGRITFAGIRVRHARRFRFDKDGQLRLITMTARQGEVLPDRKFWLVATGASNDDEPYGHGLADWLYWPTLFKRNGIRFWNVFLDKFGTPTAKATYRRGTPDGDRAKLLEALQAIATDSGIVVPEGTVIELMQAAKSGTADFEKLCRYMDEAIAKIVLSQTMTTQDGSSHSQAKVHAGVKLEVVKADADLLSDSFNGSVARWWTDLNFGTDVAAPLVVRLVDEEEDLKVSAETDEIHERTGWIRTEESFKDTYGDGYERKPDAPVPPDKPQTGVPANDDARLAAAVSFAASDPRPLYVHRTLKNAAELIAWAKRQGFTSTLPAADMHVTIAYSRRAVDWFAIPSNWGMANGELIVPAGGARIVEALGDKGAVVLHFASDELSWRNQQIRDAGASWDYARYHPHVTISYDGAPADLAAVEPFTGKLIFGPEVFEPLDDAWDEKIREASFADHEAGAGKAIGTDVVDGVVAELLKEQGWSPLTPAMAAVVDAIAASDTPDQLDAALLAALPALDAKRLTDALARASFALRTAAEAGLDGSDQGKTA